MRSANYTNEDVLEAIGIHKSMRVIRCGQCTRWHRQGSRAGYKYWTHEAGRFLDQEVQHPYVEVHHPYVYKVLSLTGSRTRHGAYGFFFFVFFVRKCQVSLASELHEIQRERH